MSQRELIAVLAAAVVAGAALAIALGRWWRRLTGSWRARRRSARALRGERDAERLLERCGYRVLDRQATRRWQIVTDGDLVEVLLRADLLVERDGRRYVGEVKTGVDAPRVANSATRRQLLEYRVAYEVDGVLLIDVEDARVVEVEFPGIDGPAAPGAASGGPWPALVGTALGAAALGGAAAWWAGGW